MSALIKVTWCAWIASAIAASEARASRSRCMASGSAGMWAKRMWPSCPASSGLSFTENLPKAARALAEPQAAVASATMSDGLRRACCIQALEWKLVTILTAGVSAFGGRLSTELFWSGSSWASLSRCAASVNG